MAPRRLGDTILRTPFFRFLKNKVPEFDIDVIVMSKLALAALRNNPYIRKIYYQPQKEILKDLQHQYDYIFNFHDCDETREYLKEFQGEHIVFIADNKEQAHITDKLLRFLGKYFKSCSVNFEPHYDLFPSETDRIHAVRQLKEALPDFEDYMLVGLHMGCYGLSKKRLRPWGRLYHKKAWPLKNFIKLAQQLEQQLPKMRFVLTGAQSEKILAEKFCKKIPNVVNLVDKTSVLELFSLMDYLKLFITNDTGALHVASASEVPIIALFGPSDSCAHGPYPYSTNRVVLQKDPIEKITVKEVFNTVLKILKIQ